MDKFYSYASTKKWRQARLPGCTFHSWWWTPFPNSPCADHMLLMMQTCSEFMLVISSLLKAEVLYTILSCVCHFPTTLLSPVYSVFPVPWLLYLLCVLLLWIKLCTCICLPFLRVPTFTVWFVCFLIKTSCHCRSPVFINCSHYYASWEKLGHNRC